MKKLYKILIIVGAVVIVATGTFLGVYFGLQNRIDNADVSIDGITVTTLTDDSLTGIVNFTIAEPTSVDATFQIVSFNVSYEGHLLGTGQVTTTEFSTKQANHSTDFTLDIADEDYFSLSFVDDFIENQNTTVSIDAKIQFTGALAALPEKTITKLVDVGGFNGLPIEINSFDLLDVAADEFQLEVEASISNPTQIAISVDTLYADIYYNDTLFGNLTRPSFALSSGANSIEVTTWIGGDEDLLKAFLTDFMGSSNFTIDIDLNITLANFNGDNFRIEKLVEDIEIASVGAELVSIEVDMISLSLSPVGYQVDTTITISNPTSAAINVTYFEGIIVYDDADGADFSIPLVGSWSYPAKDNITLTPVSFDWTSTPLELDPSSSEEDSYTYSDSNLEQAVRLYEEYTLSDSLYVSIIKGEVTIQIDSFEITVPIEIYDIYVP